MNSRRLGERIRVSIIAPSNLVEWLAAHEGRLKNTTYNEYRRFLKDVFEIAVNDQVIARSPFDPAKLKWKKPQKPQRLTPTEFEVIAADIRSQKFNPDAEASADFVEFLGLAGLGQKEAGTLLWSDVDGAKNQINLLRHKTDRAFRLSSTARALSASSLHRLKETSRWSVCLLMRPNSILSNSSGPISRSTRSAVLSFGKPGSSATSNLGAATNAPTPKNPPRMFRPGRTLALTSAYYTSLNKYLRVPSNSCQLEWAGKSSKCFWHWGRMAGKLDSLSVNLIDQATILRYHEDRIQTHGRGTCGALGWRTAASQTLRFEVLAEIADLNDRSVLDVGCGHGDLRAHLGEQFPRVHYTGLDHHSALLDVALERYGDWPQTSFLLGDFSTAVLPHADYVLASGAMGYRQQEPGFALQMISQWFAAARLGLGFNLLRRVDNAQGILAAYDPAAILDHCRQLTPHVMLREGYLDDDFTVFLYREA